MNQPSQAPTKGAKKILDAAEILFAEHGYHGVSVQDIAKAAEVSKANVYHHFNSKEDLYFAVIKSSMQEMNDILHSFEQSESSTIQRLADFSQAHLAHLNHKPHMTKLVLRELLDGSNSRSRALAEEVFNGHYQMLKSMMHNAQKSGVINDNISSEHMAVALVGLNVFLFQSWPVLRHFPDGVFKDQAESGRIFLDLLLNGMISRGEQG